MRLRLERERERELKTCRQRVCQWLNAHYFEQCNRFFFYRFRKSVLLTQQKILKNKIKNIFLVHKCPTSKRKVLL